MKSKEDGSLSCILRYFGEDGRFFSCTVKLSLGDISMVDGLEKLKEMWYKEELPGLVSGYYPRYIYVEMEYSSTPYDSIWILDMKEDKK